MERLKSMKECLMSCVEGQLSHLSEVDTAELGEAIDMIKDLSEAMYYCTITKAMEGKDYEEAMHSSEPRYPCRSVSQDHRKMYYDGYPRGYGPYMGEHYLDHDRTRKEHSEREYPVELRDYREGKSPKGRRLYMEAKELHQGKETKIKELENYMKELTEDITEMIEDASPEEKQILYKKLTTLATKMNNV